MQEKWVLLNKKGDYDGICRALSLDPLTARILANRGIVTPEQAAYYLQAGLEALPDPALLKDGETAAARICEALKKQEKLAIAADYDVDGLFAGQILKESLEGLGFSTKVFTPDRMEEGYGLNRRILEEAKDFGASLLITCDNGIASLKEAEEARALGLELIITDHHEPLREGAEGEVMLPSACGVIDPKRPDCSYPFDGICGAVVALKLMQLVYRQAGRDEMALLKSQLAYAAMATVADVMDLREENRIIVREGLKALEQTENEGIRALIAAQGLEGRPLSPYHIGFVLGPCFNAAGRLKTAMLARELLEARGSEAERLARELMELNVQRQQLTQAGLKEAEEMLGDGPLDPVLTVHLPDVHESVAGIIAGRLKEKYFRPALVITGRGDCKGSGRSIAAYHLVEHLAAAGDLLERFGGHKMAAGFSLREEKIPALARALSEKSGLTEEDLCPIIGLDAAMPPEYASLERIREWERLGPFGKGFERPLFGRSGLELLGLRVLGQKRNALRLKFSGESRSLFEGIWFGDVSQWEAFLAEHYGEKTFALLERGQTRIKIALAYQPVLHEYQGKSGIQFQIKHFQAVT